jgi:adenine deaminase
MRISGNIVDVINSEIYPGTILVRQKKIVRTIRENKKYKNYIIPGFVDSHIHIESSMLSPVEFARLAVVHGTVAVVSDPHEIANVLGLEGVNYMIENAKKTALKFFFGAPSCVPATQFETSGAKLGPEEIEILLKNINIKYLGEMMNYPGVIGRDKDVLTKIRIARRLHKLIDGHAPGLVGRDLRKYIKAGISTDHEASTKKEALEKIRLGMKIQIREGSAAKNFEALASLINKYQDQCMFCSDDKHPDDLVKGHINEVVKRAISRGIDAMKVLKCACLNPVKHYDLGVGLLRENDPADFLVVNNLKEIKIIKTFVNGRLVAANGKSFLRQGKSILINNFKASPKKIQDFFIPISGRSVNIIKITEGQLMTDKVRVSSNDLQCLHKVHLPRDVAKLVVVNRYVKNTIPAVAFVTGFGLKHGAIASSVAHDSHNIIAVGTNDQDIQKAVNLIIRGKGGLSAVSGKRGALLPLPIAGLMSDKSGYEVAREYSELNQFAKKLGSRLNSPFMTLSFMALLVIPRLKLSDRGLFDSQKFKYISVFQD